MHGMVKRLRFRIDDRRLLSVLGLLTLIGIAALFVASTSYPDLEAMQSREEILLTGVFDGTAPVRQSFIARQPYLYAIRVFLGSDSPADSGSRPRLLVRLEAHDRSLIASRTFEVAPDSRELDLRLAFAPQRDSANRLYYIVIDTDLPTSSLSVWTSLDDGYLDGDLSLGAAPLPYDLTFFTYSRPPPTIWFTYAFEDSASRFAFVGLLFMVFLILGLTAYGLLGDSFGNPIDVLSYALGLGIALPPVMLLILSLSPPGAGGWAASIGLGMLALSAAVRFVSTRGARSSGNAAGRSSWGEATMLIVLLALAGISRLAQIRDLAVPNWVDGVVHQDFTLRILERQRVALDAVYPKGFHANVAFLHELTGASVEETTLVLGQWLSLVSGLTLYALVRRHLGAPVALCGLFGYWFVSAFPGYLTNWSRYPLLQGLVLLPVSILAMGDGRLSPWRRASLSALLLMGIGLTYYGALIMALAYMAAVVIAQFPSLARSGFRRVGAELLLSAVPVGLIAVLRLSLALRQGILGQESSASWRQDAMRVLGLMFSRPGWLLWALAAVGAVVLWRTRGRLTKVLITWLAVLAGTNLVQSWLGITATSVSNTVIFMSLPLSLFAGTGLHRILALSFRKMGRRAYGALVFLALLGAVRSGATAAPETVLLLPGDSSALAWIARNTPKQSVFLINSFTWGDAPAPSDGGAWITSLTGRGSVELSALTAPSRPVAARFDYVYFGVKGGNLRPDVIPGFGEFFPVYASRGVRIFQRATP